MFEDKTCLILGAGASRPYGFPTSGELRNLLLGGDNASRTIQELGKNFKNSIAPSDVENLIKTCAYGGSNQLARFRTIFGESQRVSIDSLFRDLPDTPNNKELVKIGRDAIAGIMLLCEKNARLDGDWYQWLLEFLLRKGKDFPAGLITVITFNYERSLEQYLWLAFMRAFDVTPRDARLMLEKIEFIHVYGDLGPLVTDGEAKSPVPYGDCNQMFVASDRLRLAGMRAASDIQSRIKATIADARRLIFLGFGFWRENIEIMKVIQQTPRFVWKHDLDKLNPHDWAAKSIYASCYHLWASVMSDVNAIVGRLHDGTPLVRWGTKEQDVWQFVTHWDLKA